VRALDGIEGLVLAMSLLATLPAARAVGANYPPPAEGDFLIRDFKFATGESLPELRLHYRTFGTPRADTHGVLRNAVLILHGTGGRGDSFLSENFSGQLFGAGQPLDAARYYIILADAIGHGKSSKPSDGLHMKFPKYTYDDMVRADYTVLTQQMGINHLRLILGTSILTILINPFLPDTAKKMAHMMKVVDKMLDWENAGKTKLLSVGYSLREPQLLFRKIEDEEITAQVEKLKAGLIKPEVVEASPIGGGLEGAGARVGYLQHQQHAPQPPYQLRAIGYQQQAGNNAAIRRGDEQESGQQTGLLVADAPADAIHEPGADNRTNQDTQA